MSRRFLLKSFLFVTVLGVTELVARGAGYGFDAAQSLPDYARLLSGAGLTGKNGEWVRMRGLAGSSGEGGGPAEQQAADRKALETLHDKGVKVCVILRWNSEEWPKGVRPGGGHRLPLDLGEAFERGRRLGAAYGDLVDAWEIENEPDIGFVADNPEVMAAFFKACSLGIKEGARSGERRAGSFRSPWWAQKRGWSPAPGSRLLARSSPLVLMPPLALPPGPYFQQLWANGIASYTDGFNYHFYGYSEDFTGVYRQFATAVAELGTLSSQLEFSKLGQRKPLPVFLTEYGYGLMDGMARNTVEGRVRQWRWFADVAGQIRTLRPEGPMAFVLNPYYENELDEFGLLMDQRRGRIIPRPPSATAGDGTSRSRDRGKATMARAREVPSPEDNENMKRRAKDNVPYLGFTPSDFGAQASQPWMKRIGAQEGNAYASPALAYLQDYAARHPYQARAWSVWAPAPLPMIIDFIAGDDMRQRKDYGGYLLSGAGSSGLKADGSQLPAPIRTGHGRVVLYNFSDRAMSGSLAFSAEVAGGEGDGTVLRLAPGERRELPVELAVSEKVFSGHELRLVFTSSQKGAPPSVYQTMLYPAVDRMERWRLADFDFAGSKAEAARTALLMRPLASEEPPLQPDGRWLVSDGVKVTEADGVWRFEVSHFPAQPLRPAMVELPLPADFVFAPDTMLLFKYRKMPAPEKTETEGTRTGGWSEVFDTYLRTANGNLYQGSPRLRPKETWATYGQCAQNFTMAFFGRAAPPWRFAENRPVSLVFFLRPAKFPFTLEVKPAEIVRFTGR